jgi:HAD superfamily hydrolase (TIGR01509 family)
MMTFVLRAILFDFNGVLVDDEPIHLELFQQVLGEEGIELTAEDYYAKYLGFDDRGCFTAALEAAGESALPHRLSRLIARKASYYQARLDQGLPFFPGAAELIRAAVDDGLMLGVVSGALKPEIEGALEQLGVRAHFKTVVAAEDTAEGKPDPEGYRRGLELLNSLPPLPRRLFHPHEVLAVEDSPAGLEAAAATGLATLGVAQTYDPEMLAQADHVVGSLAEANLAEIKALFDERPTT